MTRPAGLAPGASALIAAWFAAAVIALLTGATAVVIVLAVGVVVMVVALISGTHAIRGVRIDAIETRAAATVGEKLQWHVRSNITRPTNAEVYAEVRVAADVVAAGWVTETGRVGPTSTVIEGSTPPRGVHSIVEVRWFTAGGIGLLWWRRTAFVEFGPLAVAPVAGAAGAVVARSNADVSVDGVVGHRQGRDDVDGVRTWRSGDEVNAVHWPSTVRLRELVVRERHRERNEQWTVQAHLGMPEPDEEAGRVRHSLEEGLANGARVSVCIGTGDPEPIRDKADVSRWCAAFDPRQSTATQPHWWQRAARLTYAEPTTTLRPRSRWLVAAAGATPVIMLLGPLGYGPLDIAIVLAAFAVGAAVSSSLGNRLRPVRQLVGIITAALVGGWLVDVEAITSVIASLRFLLPQLLVALVVMQGFECVDRRSARVSLSCAALLTAYSAGVRVDEQLGPWLVVAGLGLWVALRSVQQTNAPAASPRRQSRRGLTTRLAGGLVAAAGVLTILAIVPVPRGPAQLTLPSWLEERRPTNGEGGLASPDGSPLLGGASSNGERTDSTGGAGGYPGFSSTMDTSLRGDLGDEVVLRVRAPYPDFWRGQTFTRFDGRTWSVDDDIGRRSVGPEHRITPSYGDIEIPNADTFIQTFYAEVDLPNIIFAASRPTQVLLDAALWQRADGALRADVVLPEGSAYTVVSERSGATAQGLRANGDIARLGSPPELVEIPESTSDRTLRLAEQLAQPSTYDTILAIEQWLSENISYDLDAPVPSVGDDAVDHFLFQSKLGFCEQIATATAIMLRSLGVPARVATGYVPSDRDEVAGVWISRARDAHAWVEVRFPSVGWVAFDPTASVPLAGEADESTVGGDLARMLTEFVSDHAARLALIALGAGFALALVRRLRRWYQRRRRGRWGVLQDRFVAAAVRRGGSPTTSNTELAAVFAEPLTDVADIVATTLDESAFCDSWTDDDFRFEQTAGSVRTLERLSRPARRIH